MSCKFSASRGGDSKKFYKNFFEDNEEMSNMGHYLKKYAVSSYIYGKGETDTDPREACDGHRAWRSVVGAGNVLLFDFDSKYVPVTLEMLAEKFKGVSSYIAPSKGWSKEIEKYHVIVELDENLPIDKAEFKAIYRAVAQSLDIEGLYDPAMESPMQQLSPHYRDDAPEMYIEGEALVLDLVLEGYEAKEEDSKGTFAGLVPDDTLFVLSESRASVGVEDMVALVKSRGKVRTHCIAGLEHDGRRDTAFVNETDSGSVMYYCSGGRCGHTLELSVSPFQEEAEEVEEVRVATLSDIIAEHPAFSSVYTDSKTKQADIEGAISYALSVRIQQEKISRVEGIFRSFNGVFWDKAFNDSASIRAYIRQAIIDTGFVKLAYQNNFLNNTYNYFINSIEAKELEEHGNFLNLNNCVLEINKAGVKVHPHKSGYLFTSVLPYDYDPKATAPVWDTVVDRVMCGDKDTKEAFQQALGYLLLREYNLEKMVCFVGEGENGKSTILRVLKKLVGRDGYSAEPIKMLLQTGGEGGYSRAKLAGKLINITNELSPNSLEADAFKDLISGEDISARNIFEAPFTLATVPKQVVAMNTTDALIKERTHGFMRRLFLVPFNYRLKDEHKDDKLNEKLDSELSGILNWVLKGAEAVIARKGIKESLAMKRLFEGVKRDSNPAQQFVEEWLDVIEETDVDYDTIIPTGEAIHEKYKQFCGDNGYKNLGRNKFLNEIRRIKVGFIDTHKSMKGRPSRKIKGFLCSIRTDSRDFPSEVSEMSLKRRDKR